MRGSWAVCAAGIAANVNGSDAATLSVSATPATLVGMSRGRQIAAAVLVAIAALIYGASPIDVIPELVTGPLGLADDLAVFVGAGFAIWKLLSGGKGPAGDATPPTPPVA
jgi:hypothetical protein